MLRFLPILALCVAALGCERTPPPPPPIDAVPPDGSARYTDDEGQERTLLRPIGTLRYGERVDDTLPPTADLVGYEFAATAGDTPSLILDVQGQGPVSMALYGPRTDTGLWGRPLAAEDGVGVLRIAGEAMPASGYYFVLIRRLDGPDANYDLALDCEGCAEATCPDVEPCDLYCDQDYSVDDSGCRACACDEAPCETADDCLDDEVCDEGRCIPAPDCGEQCRGEPLMQVCGADGRTYPNACMTRCLEIEVVEEGPCPEVMCSDAEPCPHTQACVGGRCICECPDVVEPVCARTGRTFSSVCALECAGETFLHDGRCEGPPLVECDDANPCDRGLVCAQGGDGAGFCSIPCRLGDPRSCMRRGVCVEQEGLDAGVCLPFCRPDGPPCPDGFACQASPGERPACLPDCGCPDAEPDEAVCVDGVHTYASACTARCAGFGGDRVEAGACEPVQPADCAECPDVWAPVCADGQVRATLCDAECRGPTRRIDDVVACYPQDVQLACRTDDDCMRTGCEGSVCAAGEFQRACAPLGHEARCYVGQACGCIEGRCGWAPPADDPAAARNLAGCLERARQAP